MANHPLATRKHFLATITCILICFGLQPYPFSLIANVLAHPVYSEAAPADKPANPITDTAVQLHSEIPFASTIPSPDTTQGYIAREKTIPFHSRTGQSVSVGDTLVMYPKRELPNGIVVDFPPTQRYEVRIVHGKMAAVFVFPNGATSDDTSGVMIPIKLVGKEGSVRIQWETIALNVDTSADHLLRSMNNHEMIRKLSAPTNALKSFMAQFAGDLQLRLKNFNGARECLEEAMALDSSRKSSFYYDFACTYARENKSQEALAWLRRAFDSGYNKYLHASRDDSDLTSIRSLPEFHEIVVSPLVKKRGLLLGQIKEHPGDAGRIYFDIARSYLEQADVDSFFVALEVSLKNGFYPRLSTFIGNEYSSVEKDPRLESLLEQYAEQNPYRISSEFDAGLRPKTVRRIELNQNINDFMLCPKLVEIRIIQNPRGELSPEIANMKSLRILRYIDCGFTTFPSAITKCTALDTLTADKGLSKSLPANFGDLINLKQLKLCNGRLELLPHSFRSLVQLGELSISSNALSAFPQEVLSLPNLASLDISGNSITEIPGDIENLSSLKTLNLADNRITLLPRTIGALRQLKELDLSLNCLSDLPEEITGLRQLDQLDLSFNELKKLPRSMSKLQSLQKLNVCGNQLDASEIDTLRKLLPHCRIAGGQQNVFEKQASVQEKSFHDTALGISFGYPADFSLSTKRGGKDSSEFIIELSHRDTYEQEIDSVTYKFPSDAELTIRFSRDRFDRVAEDAGFEKNERLNDTVENDEDDSIPPAVWVSVGRQGMEEDVSVLSYEGWRGFYGTNFTGTFGESDSGQGSGYQGLHEFFVALGRKKLDHGISVSVSFFNENYEDDDVFHAVLSSFQFHPVREK
jgi:Leucine-rich repeat (LRR) protein